MTMVSAAQAGKEIDTLLYQVQQGREVVIIGVGGAAFKLIALPRTPRPISQRGRAGAIWLPVRVRWC
jgi:antitoxin (DNA-binding transcriptional repressor) of toxin-antitoxin stability system